MSEAGADPVRLLILEDVPTDAELALRALHEAGMNVSARRVENRDDFVRALDEFAPQIVLSDYRLPEFDGRAAAELVRRQDPDLPFILVTGALGDEAAVDLIQAGVTDYVLKNNLVRLAPAVRRALAVAQEVQRRKRAEAARDELARIVVDAQCGIVGAGLDGTITSCNRSAEKILESPAAQLVGTCLDQLVCAEDRVGLNRLRQTLVAGAEAEHLQSSRTTRDGRHIYLSLMMSPIRSDTGQAIGISTIVRDVTERHAAQELLAREKGFADAIIESMPGPLVVVDAQGRHVRWNQAARQVAGLSDDQMPNASVFDIVHPDDRQLFAERLREAREQGHSSAEVRLVGSGGRARQFLVGGRRLDLGGQTYLVGYALDISERTKREQELAKLHAQLVATVEELRQHERDIALIDSMSQILQACNSPDEAYPIVAMTGQQLFEQSSGALAVAVGAAQQMHTVASWGEPQMTHDFALDDCWALRRGKPHEVAAAGRAPLCKHLEQPAPAARLCVPLAMHGRVLALLHLRLGAEGCIDERIRHLSTSFADVIKLSLANLKLHEALRRQATHDPLTGLCNRQYLSEALPREVHRARRRAAPLSAVMLDIDHFKTLNDTYGHEAGDLVPRQVAQLLNTAVRASDLVCRYGGEEFLVILPDCDAPAAALRTQHLLDQIKRQQIAFRDVSLPTVTASAGIAQFPVHATTMQELIRAADQALYAAKNAGRDCVRTVQTQALDPQPPALRPTAAAA